MFSGAIFLRRRTCDAFCNFVQFLCVLTQSKIASQDLISLGAKDKRFPFRLTKISCPNSRVCVCIVSAFECEWKTGCFGVCGHSTFNKLFVDWEMKNEAINSTCSKLIQSHTPSGREPANASIDWMHNNKIVQWKKHEYCRQLFEESSNFCLQTLK